MCTLAVAANACLHSELWSAIACVWCCRLLYCCSYTDALLLLVTDALRLLPRAYAMHTTCLTLCFQVNDRGGEDVVLLGALGITRMEPVVFVRSYLLPAAVTGQLPSSELRDAAVRWILTSFFTLLEKGSVSYVHLYSSCSDDGLAVYTLSSAYCSVTPLLQRSLVTDSCYTCDCHC
jgi:hypothetical protein